MPAPDDMLFEYAVVRYVPRVDREEFVNIGLIMMCKRRKWLKGRIELDYPRLKAFDPKADLQLIENQTAMFMKTDVPDCSLPVEEKYRWMSAVKSAIIQVSPSHPGIIVAPSQMSHDEIVDLLEKEFDRLMARSVRI